MALGSVHSGFSITEGKARMETNENFETLFPRILPSRPEGNFPPCRGRQRSDRASRALRLNSPPPREGEFPSLIKKGGREWLLQRIVWDRTWDALLVSALIGAPAKADFQPAVPAPFPPARCLAH